MRIPIFRLGLLISSLLLISGPVAAQEASAEPVAASRVLSPSLTPITNEVLTEGINIPEGPLDAAYGLLELLTGRTVLKAPNTAQGTFSLVIKQPVTPSEALLAIETTLTMNNIAVAPLGERFIKVVQLGAARIESPELIEGSTLNLPPSGRIATKLFTFEFVRVEQFASKIANLLNAQLGGAMPFEQANALLVTDSISTLQRVETLVKQLDQPNVSALEPKFYPLVFAKASELANKMRTILQGPAQQQLGTGTTFNADDRTNQIIVISDPRLHNFFDKLIAKLDVRSDPNTRNEVIPLKHADATEVASLVSQLVSGQNQAASRSESTRRPNGNVQAATVVPATNIAQAAASAAGVSTNEFSTLVTILADERSNAVVVSGTVEDIRLIKELVAKIDVLLAQVRVEVVIAEVTLTDSNSSGINELNLLVDNGKLVGVSAETIGASIGGVGQLLGEATDDAATVAGSFATFSGYDLTGLIKIINGNGNRKSKANILSVPAVLTTHNKEGRVFVGRDIPTISSFLDSTSGTSTNSGFGRTTLSNREVGITLQVTPLIGANGSVQMEIKQEVSSVVDNVTVDGNEQPIIGKREAESFVTVNSGDIIVLGGLQQATENRTRNRFGPIPIISDLFGSRSKEKVRTDLIFFLRPVVLTNTEADNAEALERLESTEINVEAQRALRGEPINEK
ncbi:secretin N-terminal domain-containing protein [Synoicihabitans lomoniglobus]|uniref:Secretin N-terminal domain-containing protein n=1 Tax=Synoicihabitans lomoniglobus TaxID=2909285 RepID=A0AAF0A243_9BACT|nr:type II secretory pathway, component PulD [Opitutaceae bacterium LMO-M01]WED65692.1 secretin N-terminal domain-containing protein [Opitutaceae bacterium LMO-M01]